MTEEKSKTISDDEIDFRAIGHKVLSLLSYPFLVLLRNFKTSLFFVAFGFIVSVSLKYVLIKTYKAGFIIRPIEKNERIHLSMLGDVRRLLKSKDYKALSRELNMDEATARTLVDVEAVNYAFAKNKADSSNTTFIQLEMTDFNQLLPLQNKLLAYLENNPFFAKIKEYQKTNIALKSALIDKDIMLLDSLKRMQLMSYERQKATDQNSAFLKDLINPTATYTLSLERLNQKAGLIGQSMFQDNFQLVKGVVVSESPSWPPRILILCALIIPVSLVVCFLFLVVKARLQNG